MRNIGITILRIICITSNTNILKVVIDDILHNMNRILSDKDATIIQLVH